MLYRQANEADILQLINIRLNYLAEDYGGLTNEQTLTIRTQLREYFMKHLNRDLLVYVCEDHAEIVATVFLLITEKPANPAFITGLTGTILNVYTLPHYRKKGIAGNLMRMAISDAESKNLSYLELYATKAGYSLYRKLGFAPFEPKNVYMRYQINHDKEFN